MTMAIIPAQTGRISGIFWRRPALALFLLLLGPLMWFGIVYLGSLLTLLWQSIYTFDDFTMSVTSDFTLANLRALFNPANYDIIVRTGDGAVRHAGKRAAGAADGTVYGALHQRQNEGLLLYRGHAANVGQLYRQSLCVGAAAGERWRGAVVPRSSWTGGALNALLSVPAVGGNTLSTSGLGRFLVFVYIWLPFMILPVQAALERIPGSLLQASADLGAAPRQTFRYVVLPLYHSRHRRWVDLHLFADARRLYRATAGGPAGILYRQYGLLAAGGDRQYADGGGVYLGAYRLDCPLSGVRETSGSLRCTLNARHGICDWRPGAG